MATVIGMFEESRDVDRAIDTLTKEGFEKKQIGVVARHEVLKQAGIDATSGAEVGAITGATTGGIAGLLIGLGALHYVFRLFLNTPEGRYAWDKWKLHIPVIGPLLMKATVARFARTFATALKANVPIVTAFELVAHVMENAFFEDRILQMRKSIERGEVLSRVMRTAGIFSPLELQLIAVGERTGEVERSVDEIGQLYSEDVEFQVDRLSQTIEPLLLACMGVLVLMLVLGVFLPLWDLGQATLHHR